VEIKVSQMREHVERIISDHGIVFQPTKYIRQSRCLPWSGGARPVVQFPPVRSHLTYATALHELGHVLGWGVNYPDDLVRERDAWFWARLDAIVWTTAMERFAAACLRRAEERFGARPDDDHTRLS
jgi:hypothetical protein